MAQEAIPGWSLMDRFPGDSVMHLYALTIRNICSVPCAAIAIQKSAENVDSPLELLGPMRFGMGIHTGEAVVGNIGAAQLMSYTAIGDAVNVAKRLEESARPGQIIVSHQIVERLGERVSTKLLKPVTLKGVKDSVPVFEVIGLNE
jgi:adenylate cyclase